MHYKKTICFICIFITIASSAGYSVKAAVFDPGMVRDFTSVDVSIGLFLGQEADFYFLYPSEWFNYAGQPLVTTTRLTYTDDGELLDWYIFEYYSGLRVWEVMRLYVYDRQKWRDNNPYTVVAKTKDYVFVVSYGELSGMMTAEETVVMKRLLEAVSSKDQLDRCINCDDSQVEELTGAVIANNVVLDAKVEYINDTYYIPLREACEAFGYTIRWDNATRKISIYNGDIFMDEFMLEKGAVTILSPKYTVRLINDRVYVAMVYFVGVLRKNVSMDELGNVIIS